MSVEHGTKQGLDTLSTWVSGVTSHVGLAVGDLDEARRFYCDILGFEEGWKTEFEGPLLEESAELPPGSKCEELQVIVPGGIRIELHKYTPQGTLGDRALNNQRLNHLAFGVKDLQAEHERLVSLGVHCRVEPTPLDFGPGDPMTGFTFAAYDDPWGLMLQMFGPTPGRDANNDERPSR